MDLDRICSRLCPNLAIVLIAFVLASITLIHTIPTAFKASPNTLFPTLTFLFVVFSLTMYMWSWIVASFTDPGSVENDLRERGLLNQCRNGNIPECLQGCRICPYCQLPMPRRCHHCKDCGKCFLRQDHHCGVIGQCVADRNFKAFILSFFYASLFGFSLVCAGILSIKTQTNDVLTVVIMVYGGAIAVMLNGIAISFFVDALDSVKTKEDPHPSKIRAAKKLFATFGDKWYEKLNPVSKHASCYAWPNIEWNIENPLL